MSKEGGCVDTIAVRGVEDAAGDLFVRDGGLDRFLKGCHVSNAVFGTGPVFYAGLENVDFREVMLSLLQIKMEKRGQIPKTNRAPS